MTNTRLPQALEEACDELNWTRNEFVIAVKEIDSLREQNATLLAALEKITAGLWAGDGYSRPKILGSEVASARAVIANAKKTSQWSVVV